ncbi:MAG TPA: extracellular solute-binding protein [Chloroflexia bacterium]|nr:extracellular solute-binding protein [Chloroflexia bacterium]
MRTRSFNYLAGLVLCLMLVSLLAACGDNTATQPPAATTAAATTASSTGGAATTAASGATTAAGTGNWSLAEAAKPYKGQKVTLATVAWKDATVDLAKQFTQQTGIDLEVVQLPNADLLTKTLLDARTKTGAYDIVAHTYMTPYARPNYLVPLDEFMKGSLADPNYNTADIVNANFYTKYNNQTVALPFGSSALVLYYRKDLFDNPQYQADFKARYGYDLKPPADWNQYLDISKFFTETDWKGPSGEKGYGVAAYGKREFSMTYIYQLQFGSLEALKENTKVGLLDNKYQPTFNNATGEAALDVWKQSLQYSPPGVMQNGNTETRDIFAKGLTAMNINWDSAIGTLTNSPVKDKWAMAAIPGRTVLGGWTLSVSSASKHKEAAFLAAQFLTSVQADQYLFDKAGRYPGRVSTYNSDNYKKINPYADILAKSKQDAVPQIDVENTQIDTLVSEQISLFLNGQQDNKTTVKQMNDGITKILKDGGWS